MGVDSQGELAEVMPSQVLMGARRVVELVRSSELHVKGAGGDQGIESLEYVALGNAVIGDSS